MSGKCKAKTKSGQPCKRQAGNSGYCSIHDPKRIAESSTQNESLHRESKFEIPTKRFSERKGFKPVSEIIQVDNISKELRNSLWNVLSESFLLNYSNMKYSLYNGESIGEFIRYLWKDYFKSPIDDLSSVSLSFDVPKIRSYFQKCEWYEVYDFLEFTLNYFKSRILVDKINDVLTRELSGFRFIGGVFTDITTGQEVEMLEEATNDQNFPAVSTHLKCALVLMSNRKNPDYRNSIKESISAVESLAKIITNMPKATLGDALKTLERSNRIHSALKDSFLKLYGYTSDEEGIRHAMLDEPNLTVNDAKFFLLSCTSFTNYLKSKI